MAKVPQPRKVMSSIYDSPNSEFKREQSRRNIYDFFNERINPSMLTTEEGKRALKDAVFAAQEEYGLTDLEHPMLTNILDDVVSAQKQVGMKGAGNKAQIAKSKQALAPVVADLTIQATKLGLSAVEALKARAELKGLQRPELGLDDPDTSQLDSLINQTAQKAQGIFPEMQEEERRAAALSEAQAQKTARQFGVSGAGLQQSASIAERAGAPGRAATREQLRMQYGGQLAGLLGQREGIRRTQQSAQEREFYKSELPQFQAQTMDLAGLRSTSRENLFGTLESLPYNLSGAQQVFGEYSGIKGSLAEQRRLEEAEAAERDVQSVFPEFRFR